MILLLTDCLLVPLSCLLCRDLLHWTAGPGPAATSMMHYAGGSTRQFRKRERPSLLLDDEGFPLVLYSGAQAPNASYHCGGPWNVSAGQYHNGGDDDRKCHCWIFAQATTHNALPNGVN